LLFETRSGKQQSNQIKSIDSHHAYHVEGIRERLATHCG
jgi:hypothetical protein